MSRPAMSFSRLHQFQKFKGVVVQAGGIEIAPLHTTNKTWKFYLLKYGKDEK